MNLGLAPEHRRWLAVYAIGLTGVLDLCLTGGIAWLAVRHQPHIPLWQGISASRAGLLTDTVGTFFFLPFLTTLLLSPGVRAAQRGGELPRIRSDTTARDLASHLPERLVRRGLYLGLITMIIASAVAVPVLFLAVGNGLSRAEFVVYKGVLAFGLGLVIAPLVALCAMTDDAKAGDAVAAQDS